MKVYYHNILFLAKVLAVFIYLFTVGCTATYPTDIKLVKLQLVDYKYQKELPPPYTKPKEYTKEWMKKIKLPVGKLNYGSKNKPHKPLLRIEFSSNENLAEIVTIKNYPLGFESYFCKFTPHPVLLGGTSIFWDRINLSYIMDNPIHKNIVNTPITYYTYLNIYHNFQGPSSFKNFDLRDKPMDVCLRLRGGVWGFGYESNELVIPKAEIIKILEKEKHTSSP